MTYDEIKTIFDSFIEFPEESDKLTVTTTSCILFARHIAKIAEEREREACAKLADGQIERWVDDRARYASSECAAAIRARSTP